MPATNFNKGKKVAIKEGASIKVMKPKNPVANTTEKKITPKNPITITEISKKK